MMPPVYIFSCSGLNDKTIGILDYRTREAAFTKKKRLKRDGPCRIFQKAKRSSSLPFNQVRGPYSIGLVLPERKIQPVLPKKRHSGFYCPARHLVSGRVSMLRQLAYELRIQPRQYQKEKPRKTGALSFYFRKS